MRQRSRRQGRAYAAIPNAAMRNAEISIEARGLLALLMTYADDWTFVVSHLQSVAAVGRDKLRKMLSELEAAGYVVREVIRGEGGLLGGTEWLIVDDPDGGSDDGTGGPAGRAAGKPKAVSNIRTRLDQLPNDDDGSASASAGSVSQIETWNAVAGDEAASEIWTRCEEQPENCGDNRAPEIQGIGGTDRLKNRPPEKPTAGFSDPIRRTTLKNTNLKTPPNPPAGGAGVDDLFSDFWAGYPHRVEETAARRAWGKVASAENAEAIIAAAEAYANDDRVKRGFPKLAANWLLDRCWQDIPSGKPGPASAAPRAPVDLDGLSDLWAPKVVERAEKGTAGPYVPSSAISAALARHMLAKGAVTADQLRKAGIAA